MVGLLLLLGLMALLVVVLWLQWQSRARERLRAEEAELRARTHEGLSHDVNNMLTVVASHLYGVDKLVLKDPEEALEVLRDSLDSLRVAILLSRGTVGRTADLPFESIVRLHARLARVKGTIHLRVRGDLPRPANADAAARIVQNLLSNATREAAATGGPVGVQLEPDALRITNRVRNPGRLTDEIYERGVSYSDSTGTGLALCRELAAELDWELSHEVAGREVTFTLKPRREIDASEHAPPGTVESVPAS